VGALALHDNVIGGAFLHPMGKRAKTATARTGKTDFKALEYMFFAPHFRCCIVIEKTF
jgi:hypothetical protein